MQWTHEELRSFPIQNINVKDLCTGDIITFSSSNRTFVLLERVGNTLNIVDGYHYNGSPVGKYTNWSNVNSQTNYGWLKVIIGKDYDPTQQPYEDTDI